MFAAIIFASPPLISIFAAGNVLLAEAVASLPSPPITGALKLLLLSVSLTADPDTVVWDKIVWSGTYLKKSIPWQQAFKYILVVFALHRHLSIVRL